MHIENYIKEDGIIACATGGNAHTAIAVVRISGPIEPELILEYTNKSGPIEPRKAYLVDIISEKEILDQVVLTYFKGPNSYTGENVFELSTHGNPLLINKVIDFFSEKLSLRKANPGEFSYRALKNKKLSLSQIEGLDVLLNSRSSLAIESGLKILHGELEQDLLQLKTLFLKVKSSLELNIDFSEDIGEKEGLKLFKDSLADLKVCLKTLVKRGSIEPDSILKPKIVLFGKPNAGKSTLFNSLLMRNRSIVSDIAGTTRDYVTERLMIDGNEFELIDTAGLRESSDVIESAGINLTNEILERAFFKIHLISAIDPEPKRDDADLVIYTHTDLAEVNLSSGSIGADLIKDNVCDDIYNACCQKFKDVFSVNPIIIPRHRELINKIYSDVDNYIELSATQSDIAILGSELNLIEGSIDELLGQVTSDEVLANIFENFCIGK